MSAHRLRGLTLIELLIAITIFAMLGVGLSSHLRAATLVWRRAIQELEVAQELRVAVAQLERDLVNATPFDDSGKWTPASTFAHQELRWYARRTGLHEQDPASIRYVRYARNADGALTRVTLTPQEAHAGTATHEPEILMRHVSSFEVRYALIEPGDEGPSLQWYDEWPQATLLPGLVEIQLSLSNAAGGRQIDRMIHIPGGTLQRIESSS